MWRRGVELAQYTSIRLTEHLALEQIRPSIGTVGYAYDNALMETINGLYKAECIRTSVFHPGPYKTLADVEYATAGWVDWYNNRRLHSSLAMVPPAEYEQAHYAALNREPRPHRRIRAETGSPYRGGPPTRSNEGSTMIRARASRDERRRTLSQNFLVARGSITRFLDAADLEHHDNVVEVGAGSGALTGLLADRCAHLVAYEIDRSWSSKLEAEVARRTNVEVVYQDFLTAALPIGPIKVVGNIPFGTTSAIVDRVLGLHAVRSATFITQFEYAKKRSGAYGRWSRLTATTWPEHEWELRGRIPRSDFRPVPRVDAGVLHLRRRDSPLVAPGRMQAYAAMVELAFSGVGGSVRASLSRQYPSSLVHESLGAAGVPADAVVAYVSPDQWVTVFRGLDREASAASVHAAGRRRGPQPPRRRTR